MSFIDEQIDMEGISQLFMDPKIKNDPNKAVDIDTVFNSLFVRCSFHQDPKYIQKVLNFITFTLMCEDYIHDQKHYRYFGYIWWKEKLFLEMMWTFKETSGEAIPHQD